ncbi:MAG: hypothetical protein LBB62_02850, partial [Proteiniphilum sp.]|nr:hypothetical protein [Proteiniphilum sp.]
QYLLAFEKQDLPFKMDRKAVFEMINNADSFFEIKDRMKIFIPMDLIKDYPDSKFRSLYVLPEYNEIVLILILQDFINEYNMRVIKNHIVSYDKNGVVIDYQELAGGVIDAWEAYLEIANSYTVKRKLYQYRVNNDKEEIRYFRLIETCYVYTINNAGLIEETKRIEREGYFEGDRTGYSFVKPIKKD